MKEGDEPSGIIFPFLIERRSTWSRQCSSQVRASLKMQSEFSCGPSATKGLQEVEQTDRTA